MPPSGKPFIYFISYAYSVSDRNWRFGNTVLGTASPIASASAIKEICKYIHKEEVKHATDVKLINFQRLEADEHLDRSILVLPR